MCVCVCVRVCVCVYVCVCACVSVCVPAPQVTAGTAKASRLKKALFNKAMKSKTKEVRRYVT